MLAWQQIHRTTNRWQTALTRFFTKSHGAVQVGYALITCLVVAVLIPTAVLLNRFLTRSFSDASRALSMSHDVSLHHDERPDVTAPREADAGSRAVLPWALAAVALSAVGVSIAWLFANRQNTKPAKQHNDEDGAQACLSMESVFLKRQSIYRILAGDPTAIFGDQITVKSLMTKSVVTVSERAAASKVRELMARRRLRHVLVCDSNRLVGIISDRDLHSRPAATASDVMTANPLNVSPDSLVGPAITLIVKNRISCLPVVSDDRLLGVLTTTDLLFALQSVLQTLQRLSSDVSAKQLRDENDLTTKETE